MSSIIQMDLFQRLVKQDAIAFCGVVYCKDHFDFKEGPAYLLDFEASPPSLYSDTILPPIESNKRFSLDDAIRSKDWIPTHNKGTSLARIFKLGDKENGFLIFGINNKPLFDCPENKRDCIASLRNGQLKYSTPSEDLGHLKIGSVIQQLYFCHNLSGQTILPAPISAEAKDHFKAINKKRLELAKGQISKGEFNQWALQSPERLFFKKFGTEDPEYLQFLLHMDEAGIINRRLDCMSVSEKHQLDHLTSMICQNLIKPHKGKEPSNDPGPEAP